MNEEERNQIVETLKEQYPIEEQINFNEFNINEKLEENTKLKFYYQELLDREKYKLQLLEDKLDEVKGKAYEHYKFDSDLNLQKGEIEQYFIPRNKEVKKYKKALEKQQVKVEFFKMCVNAVDRLYWSMKNYIENNRFN